MKQGTRVIIPIILAGGIGMRLWPVSRSNHPKQFLQLTNDETLFQQTISRLKHFSGMGTPIIAGNYDHRYILAEQVRLLDQSVTFLLEKKMRNTAAAVALSTLYAMNLTDDPLLLFLPADHYIEDQDCFQKMITESIPCAESGKLVLYGVKPTSPNIHYGYIKPGKPLPYQKGFFVDSFVEKPDHKTAQTFFDSNEFFWNSGIFLCKASTLIRELGAHAPNILSAAQKAVAFNKAQQSTQEEFIVFDEKTMEEFPVSPIDIVILEHTANAVVFPFVGEWKDVGDWHSLYDLSRKDPHQNVVSDNVVVFNTENCFLYTEGQLIIAAGMENCIVVSTSDVLYIAPLNKKQDIKKIVNTLLDQKRKEVISYPSLK